MPQKFPSVYVVLTGVCGTGKSSVADRLSRVTGIPVADAADFHPAINRRKIATGQSLCTSDLTGWLNRMRDWLAGRAVSGTSAILTCPPMTRTERDVLREAEDVSALTGEDAASLLVIELTAPRDVLVERSANRSDHLIPVSVLDAQLGRIESLERDEYGAVVDATGEPGDVAERVLATIVRLRSDRASTRAAAAER